MTEKFTRGSGNLFADLDFDNPEEMETKAKLVSQINAIIKKRKLTQKGAGAILEITQSRVSDLARGGLSGFSLDRLFRLLNKLDRKLKLLSHAKEVDAPQRLRLLSQTNYPSSVSCWSRPFIQAT
jgi:predicted XRE-type DNA-binding protein